MKLQHILYLIFTALILAYPLYEKRLVPDIYRAKILYIFYAPLALVVFVLTAWMIISSVAESLKISSFEIRARYRFEYKENLNVTIAMMKANPIKAYIVNSKEKTDSLSFTTDNPNMYYPNKHTVEFKFDFTLENPAVLYGKRMGFLEKYDSIYFPWKSFTHYLALLKVGGQPELSSDPILFFQIIINGKVYLDQIENIKDIDPGSTVLIYRPEPEVFKDIEMRFMDL